MKSGALIAAAAAAMALSGTVLAEGAAASATAATADAVHCLGINTCKGTSACKSAENACKGQNVCKGHGFLIVGKSECEKKGRQDRKIATYGRIRRENSA
jgi:uncharacterized membrane protein